MIVEFPHERPNNDAQSLKTDREDGIGHLFIYRDAGRFSFIVSYSLLLSSRAHH